MKVPGGRTSRIVALVVAVFVVVAIVLVAIDWKEVKSVMARASWPPTVVAVAFALASDACLSYGYVLVNRAFSIRLNAMELLQIGFVSSTINNIMAFLGAAGHSMRLMLLRQRSVESGEIIGASIFHSYVNNVIMLALFVVGLVSLLFHHSVTAGSPVAVIFGVGVVVALFAIVTAMVLVQSLRRWILNAAIKVWHAVTRRDASVFMANLDDAMTRGLQAFGTHRFLLAAMLTVMAAEWAFAAGGLWFCFAALGKPPHLLLLLAGFSIGISAGNLSMLPGGIGVQEASMAGVFAFLGVPFAQAALAAIMFRIVNNFIPFFVSLPFYLRLLRKRS
jgi:uncharacterized protein (TIRG00374 family)